MSVEKKIFKSPILAFFIVLAVVIATQFLVDLLLNNVPVLNVVFRNIITSVLLVLVTFPILFWLLVKPSLATVSKIMKSEKWFKAIYDASPIGIEVYNEKGELQEINPACLEIFGIDSIEQVKGFKLFEDPNLSANLKEDIKKGKSAKYEIGFDFEKIKEHKLYETTRSGIIYLSLVITPFANGYLVQVKDLSEQRWLEEAFSKLYNCYLEFGPGTLQNIETITKYAGTILDGTCALYNRLRKDLLCSEGQWQTPPDYRGTDKPEGHICYDVIKNDEEPLIVRDLPKTKYNESDPNVKKYNLITYIGYAVKIRDKPVGSLCIVYQRDKDFNPAEIRLLSVLAKSLGVEEERKTVADDLGSKMSDLEIMNKAAVGRELRMIELEEEIKKLKG